MCLSTHCTLFCVAQKASPHSHYTHRRSHSTQSLFELQSHFKQRNKAWSLASLSGISSPQSQQLQPPNDEAETRDGVLVYGYSWWKHFITWICSTDPSHYCRKTFFFKMKANRDKECGAYLRHLLHHGLCATKKIYCCCIIHASITSPPPPALTFVLKTHTHSQSHVRAHRQRDGGKKGSMNYGLCIKI